MILSEYGIDWRMGYLIFTLAMVVIGLAFWWLIRMLLDRWGGSNGSHKA
jgi:hypothetical protein